LGLILLDVMVRRIAWDWASIRRMGSAVKQWVRSYTQNMPEVENAATLQSLKRVRGEVAEQKFQTSQDVPRPDPKAKFEAKGVEGDITQIVGGAANKPVGLAKKPAPQQAAGPEGITGSLFEAKRRAQRQIREKEGGDEQK
jgi:hypothetical protein